MRNKLRIVHNMKGKPMPSLPEFVATIRQLRAPCAVVVQKAAEGRKIGLCVIITTRAMLERLEPILKAVTGEGDPSGVGPRAILDSRCPVSEYFAELQRVGLDWCIVHEPENSPPAVSVFLLGEHLVTQDLADKLTAAGCFTNLNPPPLPE